MYSSFYLLFFFFFSLFRVGRFFLFLFLCCLCCFFLSFRTVFFAVDFFFSSRRRHTRCSRDWEFRRVLFRSAYYRKGPLLTAGFSGFAITALGIGLAFVPPPQISSIWRFEAKTMIGSVFFVGLGAMLFRIYAARKPGKAWKPDRPKSVYPGEGL